MGKARIKTAFFAAIAALFADPKALPETKRIADDDRKLVFRAYHDTGARRFARNVGQERTRRRAKARVLRSLRGRA